jgi:hypothetical protein
VRFRGTPRALAAIVERERDAAGVHAVRFDAAAKVIESVAVSAAADPIVRLHLPSNTPPGTYRGRIEIRGQEESVEIVVEPEILLRLFPEQLVFEAAPGDRVPFELTLVNAGNVPVEIRDVYAFGIFDIAGPERAIGKMVGEAKNGQRRVDVFADAIADEHGGLVRVKIDSGSGEARPDTSTQLTVTIHVPDRVRPGHTYWGTWPMHNLKYYVRITGRASGERRDEARS